MPAGERLVVLSFPQPTPAAATLSSIVNVSVDSASASPNAVNAASQVPVVMAHQ